MLVLRCQGGEAAALDALVVRWHPKLCRLARRLTGDFDGASDLVQDAWVAIVRGVRRLEDPARFRVWAYRIVTNKCADWIRRRRVRRDAAREMQAAANARSNDKRDATPEDAGDVDHLYAALRELPDDQRAILSLHYLEGLGIAEIAAVFDLPTGTVKSRLHNARARMRTILQETDHERTRQENR